MQGNGDYKRISEHIHLAEIIKPSVFYLLIRPQREN